MQTRTRQGEASGKTTDLDRPSYWLEVMGNPVPATHDLRSTAPSATRDRSAHRQWAWFYDDLLN